MPAERVQSDISRGTLVEFVLEDAPLKGFVINMSAVYRTNAPPGPAGRWFIDRLKQRPDVPVPRRSPRRGRPKQKPRPRN